MLLWPGSWCQSRPWPPLSCMPQKVAGVQPSASIPPCRRVRCAHTPYPPCSPGEEGPQMHHCPLVDQGVPLAVHQLKGLALEDLARAIGGLHLKIHLLKLNLYMGCSLAACGPPLTSIDTGHSGSHLKHNFDIMLRWNYMYSETLLIRTSDVQFPHLLQYRFYWNKVICNNPTVHYCSLSSFTLFTNYSQIHPKWMCADK